jgi:hypothetical protein
MGLPKTLRVGIIEVALDPEKVGPLASKIAQSTADWDELNWLLAESELRLFPAYADRPKKPNMGSLPLRVQLIPAKVILQPKEDQIRPLAWDISELHLGIRNLVYYIAQRIFISEEIQKGRIKE